MNVLKIGTERSENIKSIYQRRPKSVAFVGTRTEVLSGCPVTYFESLEKIPNGSYDLIIVDEWSYFNALRTRWNFSKDLKRIYGLLRNDGKVLIALPERMKSIKYRYKLKKLLAIAGFYDAKFYLCEPSSEYPLKIIPYSEDPSWFNGFLRSSDSKSQINWTSLPKRWLKRFLSKRFTLYAPIYGLLVVAAKSTEAPSQKNPSLFERIKELGRNIMSDKTSLAFFLSTNRYDAKQLAFIYDASSYELLALGKIAQEKGHRFKWLKQEYQNTLYVSKKSNALEQINVAVPKVLYFEACGETTFYIESAVQGTPLTKIARNYSDRRDRAGLLNIMKRLTDIQTLIQEELSRCTPENIPVLDKAYFENYLNIQAIDSGREDPTDFHDQFIQHGDFTDVNIFFDPAQEKWGIIDWEWMAKGYPPLFDLFSLFRSIGFKASRKSRSNEFQDYFDSFVDSFFSENWFTECERDLIQSYCNRFSVKSDFAFGCFTRYLLFHCNKYRLDYNLPEFKSMYEEMLKYSIQHKEKFIL